MGFLQTSLRQERSKAEACPCSVLRSHITEKVLRLATRVVFTAVRHDATNDVQAQQLLGAIPKHPCGYGDQGNSDRRKLLLQQSVIPKTFVLVQLR